MKHTGQPEERPENANSQDANRDAAASRTGHQKKPSQGVAPEIARQIDENLKRLYQQQVDQELPAELQALVARLKSGDVPADPDGKDEA